MIKLIFSIITSLVFLCLITIWLVFSAEPAVQAPPPFSHEDISKLRKSVDKANPFKYQRYKHQALIIDEHLLNQSANFALSQVSNVSVKVKLEKNSAKAAGSIPVPNVPNLYINFSCNIMPANNLVQVTDIHLGYLPIPHWLANKILPAAMQYAMDKYPDYVKVLETINKIEIAKNKLTINYHWNTSLSKKIKTAGRNLLLNPEQQKLLAIYYQKLGELSRLYFWRPIGLHKIVTPLFELAKTRSEAGADPIKENEAAMLALGIMASGVRANHLLQKPNSKPFRNAVFFRLSLSGRRDLMQHFLISAALAVSTNKLLSDTIGLSKEIDDSEGGSGFSFADLLADRAGVRLAQMATQDESSAQHIQTILAQDSLVDTDFMPPHKKLPESISALEFKKTYIDVKHEKYLFVERELQNRINSRSIYQIP